MTLTPDTWRQSGTLLRGDHARDVLPCGCVPLDGTRRCPEALQLRDERAEAFRLHGFGSPQWDAAFGAMARHLNGD